MKLTKKLLKFFTSKFFIQKYILNSPKFHLCTFFIAIFAYCYIFVYFFGDYPICKTDKPLDCTSLNQESGFAYYFLSFAFSIVSIILLISALFAICLFIVLVKECISGCIKCGEDSLATIEEINNELKV